MAALGAQSIASSYEQLLHVDRDGGGNTTTHVSVKDGDNGTTFALTLATDAVMITSTNRLEFGDTGTYIHQSADGVLDLVSDTEIEINATTIDMNGALDVSGTVTVGADGSGTDVIFYSGTAGDNFTWDASEEKLTITGTNAATALDVADGNVTIADDLAVDGTSNLDNTDIDGTFAVDGTTISLDATTSFNIDNTNTSNGVTVNTATSGGPISIGHATSETTVNDNLSVTGDMAVDGTANLDEVDIDGAVQIDNTITVGADDQGYDVIFYGDTASSNMTWDTSEDDLVLNDSRLFINQDDNVTAIDIDSESTTEPVVQIDTPQTTTHYVLSVANADSLTTGSMARFHSNSSTTDTRNLVNIINDNSSATGATALKLQQDANQEVMNIAGGGITTAKYVNMEDATLTTGNLIQAYSNSASTSTRSLVKIVNDHASADATVGLLIQQDGADASIELTGNGSIKFPGTQGASSDANSLDDYEEGTFTMALDNTTETIENATGHYVKIGSQVTCTWHSGDISSIASTGGDTVLSGLPFTSKSTSNSHSSLVTVSYNTVAPTADGGFVTTNGTTINLIVEGSQAHATWAVSSGTLMVSCSYFTH